ncbi:MAG TPA: complex I NDUFA9 subunit family protein [Gemmatimonadales bacterium]|nr:complex I NDUFA9 subunit family protein [Gemmatimonadales bacterium]
MRIAVTGGTGFVGRHLIRLLLERGHEVRALVRRPERDPFRGSATIETVSGHLRDTEALRRLADGADAVVHLVGIIVERGSATFEAVHVEGTRAVLEAARSAGCSRFVHMSAVGARDTPDATPYHRTKARAEELVRSAGIAAAIFRPSFIVGPESVPIRVLARLHRLLPAVPVFGDGQFPIQPVWVGDVALAFAIATERAELMGTFELGGPEVVSYEEFVRAVGRALGRPRPLVHVPLPLVRLAARACDPLGPLAPITSDQLQMLTEGAATPNNAMERVFGIRPRTLEEALTFLSRRSVP